MRKLFVYIFLSQVWLASVQAQPSEAGIASAHPLATQAGFEILQQGGNAFDAAVAVSATLAVVEPYSSGIGGGGFWLLHREQDHLQVMVDGRETAPLKATRTMYQDSQGEVIAGASVNGPLAAGIPGVPAALVYIAKHYGRLSLQQSLAPAIRAARKGFKVTALYRRMAQFRLTALQDSPAAADVFLLDDQVPPLGHVIKQPDLANTLEAIARQGHDGFYTGNVAQALVMAVQQAGGIWQLEDLQNYQARQRQPIIGEYHGYRIVSAPPPSSGGVALVTMLNILKRYSVAQLRGDQGIHLRVEAMRRAYHDRAEFLGDSDFVTVPVRKLISQQHADQLRSNLQLDKATPSSELKPVTTHDSGHHTTHFSIIDTQGNRVAATLSINYPFGSGFMPAGTGVLLNDEMDDFSAKPGVPNVYGLVGAEANAIQPGKRMLSSMSPTFVEGPDKIAIIGTPGGSRIITMVLHGILGVIRGDTAQAIVSQPRYHHQYLPDVIQFEPQGLVPSTQQNLQQMGHQLRELENTFGNMQLVIWDKQQQRVTAASDPRGEGLAQVK